MGIVCEFKPVERIIVDMSAVNDLFNALGDRAAEETVMERVESISDQLAEIDGLLRDGPLANVAPIAQQVSQLCLDIGLVTLARVSRDMAVTARQEDPVASRAVWERLVRIGDRSLAQVWELPGLTM